MHWGIGLGIYVGSTLILGCRRIGMDILEMQKKKAVVEHAIDELLNTFEEETNMRVYDIDFDRGIEMTQRGSFIFNVNLDIRL